MTMASGAVRWSLALTVALFVSSIPLGAQSRAVGQTVTGVVLDPSGAVLPRRRGRVDRVRCKRAANDH